MGSTWNSFRAPLLHMLAAGLVALAWLLEWSTWPMLASAPLAPFITAVAISARYAGLGPALLSVGLSFLLLTAFLLAPDVRPIDNLRNDLVGLAAFLVVALAITSLTAARGRAEEAARAEAARFRAMAEAVPGLLFTCGPDGSADYASPAFDDLAGGGPGSALGLGWLGAVHPDDRPRLLGTDGRLRPPPDGRLRMLSPGGAPRWFLLRLRPVAGPNGATARWFGVGTDIDDLVHAEAAVRRREEYLRVITDSIPALISHVDADLRYRFNNRAYEEWFGIDRERLLGRTIEEVIGPDAFRSLRPILDTALGGEPISCERWLPYPNRSRHVTATYVPDFDPDGRVVGLFVLVNDITPLRRAEERFRLAGEAVNGVFYDWDVASGRVDRSAALQSLLGFEPDEAGDSGGWWIERIHPDDLPRALQIRDEMLRPHPAGGGPATGESEYRLRHRDGSYRTVWDRSRIVRDHRGDLVRVVGFVVDVTARRQMEEDLREADRRKDEFLAMLAHELRNPLSSVSNAVRLLSRADTDPHRSRAAREILDRQVRHLSRLVDDLLDVSRITRGKIRLRRQPVDAPAVADRALDAVRPFLQARSQRLAFPAPPPGCWVDADPTRLEQILTNLLTNASKYSDDGARINLTIDRDAHHVSFSVRDDGIGIPADKLPRIFDLFAQVDPSMDRAHGGLGIGLTLVKTLVELHGGSVSARSDGPGQGSVFTVLLPAAPAGPPAPPPSPSAPSPREAPGARVLIVDDNTDSSGGLAWLLQAHGYTVRTSADGLAALAVAPEFLPDIALLDIGLPGLNGYQLAPALRALPGLGRLILIAVTGYGQESDRSLSRSSGFDDHLVKPVDLDSLLASMSRLLSSRTTA